MAIPTDSRSLNQALSLTRDAVRPVVVDLFFNSNTLFARLNRKNKIKISGGDEIRVPFIYDKLPGGWYSGLGGFSTSQKEVITVLRFDWKQAWSEFTLPEIDIFKNRSPHQLVDLMATQMQVATMSLAEFVGTAIFNDGSDSTALTGLRLATNTTGSYGKVTRGTDTIGTAVKGNVDTTGGAITVALVNDFMGQASRGGAVKPDLLITTRALWDALWTRVQPQQRYDARSGPSWDIGARYLEINGSAITMDSHCTSGYMFGLNTDYVEFFVGEGKDFILRGPFEMDNQDGITAQLLLYCELCLQAPSLCFQASGLTV